MEILIFVLIVGFILWVYYNSNNQTTNRYMSHAVASPQTQSEIKRLFKQSLINEIRANKDIREFKGTDVESMLILNLIANFYQAGLKNMVQNRLSMGLTEQETITIVKSATNEVMDIYIHDSKQFHVK